MGNGGEVVLSPAEKFAPYLVADPVNVSDRLA
jgi:hypothetical protein